jgi:general secretion pathway protein G
MNIKARIIKLAGILKDNRGFTLLELMIVVAIIAIMAGFAVTRFTGVLDNTKVTAVKTDFKTYEFALEAYYMKNSQYPTTDQGLQLLVDEGFIKKKNDALLDPWNTPYQYRYPGEYSDGPELWSLGADGVEGGDGVNADIFSWE